MEAADVREGAAVVVRAADDFYQFIDGWRGTVGGWEQGHVIVNVLGDDGIKKVFYVPPEQLEEAAPWHKRKKKLVTRTVSAAAKKFRSVVTSLLGR